MASFNPYQAGNINRMTILMSISEITPQVYISGQMAATAEQVQKLGITYILNVAVESAAIIYPKHIKLDKYEIIDFPTAPISNYFNTLTDKIHAHLMASKQNKVLVHCMAGISRSTTIVCAYLLRYMNMSLRDAYLLCKKHRPICFPNLGFWNQLISYEYQIRKENTVRMIPTQLGHMPDVAFDELKEIRGQTHQPVSLPFYAPTFASNSTAPSINASSTNDSLFLSSNAARPTARDVTINSSTNTIRSRSLANANTTNRPTVLTASNNINSPSYQTLTFATNKPTFSMPTRFGIGRINPPPLSTTASNAHNISLPSALSTSSASSYVNRNLPISTAPNIRTRANLPPASIAAALPNSTTSNQTPRSHYETTYRSSFIKPLVP